MLRLLVIVFRVVSGLLSWVMVLVFCVLLSRFCRCFSKGCRVCLLVRKVVVVVVICLWVVSSLVFMVLSCVMLMQWCLWMVSSNLCWVVMLLSLLMNCCIWFQLLGSKLESSVLCCFFVLIIVWVDWWWIFLIFLYLLSISLVVVVILCNSGVRLFSWLLLSQWQMLNRCWVFWYSSEQCWIEIVGVLIFWYKLQRLEMLCISLVLLICLRKLLCVGWWVVYFLVQNGVCQICIGWMWVGFLFLVVKIIMCLFFRCVQLWLNSGFCNWWLIRLQVSSMFCFCLGWQKMYCMFLLLGECIECLKCMFFMDCLKVWYLLFCRQQLLGKMILWFFGNWMQVRLMVLMCLILLVRLLNIRQCYCFL